MKIMARKILTIYSLVFFLSVFSTVVCHAVSTEQLVLIKNGVSNYEVVVDVKAAEGAKQAANELVRLLVKSTGVKLQIVHEATNGRKQIVIGNHKMAADAGINAASLDMDSYIMRILDGDLYLVGRDDELQPFYLLNTKQSASAGSYFAVIDFCRRFLNARWYMPGPLGEELERHDELSVPANLNESKAPFFKIRSIDVAETKTAKRENNLRKQGYLDGSYFDAEIADVVQHWGRHLRLGSNYQLKLEHAWHKWLPAEKAGKFAPQAYGKSNPEYFAVPGGNNGRYYYGADKAHGGQLCICNPDVARVVANNIIGYAKKTGERVFSLSPNDGAWECKCECCKKWEEVNKEGSSVLTDKVLEFSNQVADLVKASIPDAQFGWYAYQWTQQPPLKQKIDNTIHISDVYNGLAYRFYDKNEKEHIEKTIRQWRSHVDSMVLTSYYTFYGNYSLPWSTPDILKWLFENIRTADRSSGLRMNYALLDFAPVGVLGADPWILSELLWDPDQSVDQLETQYYTEAFGADAGGLIKQYFLLIRESMKDVINRQEFVGARHIKKYIIPAYGKVRSQCHSLIEQAVKAVASADSRYRWRVDRVARGWQLTEYTLDAMMAEKQGRYNDVAEIQRKRKLLLNDEESRFALAPASLDHHEVYNPITRKRD